MIRALCVAACLTLLAAPHAGGAPPNRHVHTISTDARPLGMGIDEQAGRAFVAARGAHAVQVVDLRTDSVVATVADNHAAHIAVSAPHRKAYVLHTPDTIHAGSTGWLAVIDTHSLARTCCTTVGRGAFHGLAVDTRGNLVLVPNAFEHSLSVLNAGDLSERARVPLGSLRGPVAVAVDEVAGRAYVAGTVSSSVAVVDIAATPPSLVATIQVGANPSAVLADPANRAVYVAERGQGTVGIIDAVSMRLVARVAAGHEPRSLAQSPVTGLLYVSDGSARLRIIDPVRAWPHGDAVLPSAPWAVASFPERFRMYATMPFDDGLAALTEDLADPVSAISTPDGAVIAGTPGRAPASIRGGLQITEPVRGTAADDVSGVARVEVAFTPDPLGQGVRPPQGTLTSTDLSPSCDARRLRCTWAVEPPTAPGWYSVRSVGYDRSGRMAQGVNEVRVLVL